MNAAAKGIIKNDCARNCDGILLEEEEKKISVTASQLIQYLNDQRGYAN